MADNLHRCLRTRGKSQRTMADFIGMSRQHFGKVLAGDVSVGLRLHERMAVGIEVDPGDLFEELPNVVPRVEVHVDLCRTLSRNLRSAMFRRGLTSRALAVLAGVAERTVNHALGGDRSIGYDPLANIAVAVGTTPSALVRDPPRSIFCTIDDTTAIRPCENGPDDSKAGEVKNAVQLRR